MGRSIDFDGVSGPDKMYHFLQCLSEMLTSYILSQNDRSSKVLDFHHPHQLKEMMSHCLDVHPEARDLEQVLSDVRETLKYCVKTGSCHFRSSALPEPAVHRHRRCGRGRGVDSLHGQHQSVGGAISNLYGALSARHYSMPEVKTDGIASGAKAVMFTSEHSHFSIKRSAAILGIGTNNVILVRCHDKNFIIPGWPKTLRQLNTFKVIRIHLQDLFLNVDRSPYTGSCQFVHDRLAGVKMPKLEEMPVYNLDDWYRIVANVKPQLTNDQLKVFDNYKPSLTPREQRFMLFAMLSATQAFAAFNITYFISEGTLIGYWRHHGIIPWDDDVDILFDSQQWQLARQVLSCLPDLELNMGSDYMWKLYHKGSDFWKGEPNIKFPFIDFFMYNHDSAHLWPVCIWMKTEILLPIDWALPVEKGVFEGYPVYIPHKPAEVLDFHFGRVSSDCYSRTFLRRERFLVPPKERIHMPCSLLTNIYPFVVRTKVDTSKGTVTEERIIASKVLSTFNTTYHGLLD
ncbi:glutamate decarboxylase gad1 [Bulinus truncatus]|nr:glutamate decarboxylase gad1 [Bulinus truncatus]